MALPVVSFTVATPSPYTLGTVTDTSSYISPVRSGYGVFVKAFKMTYLGGVEVFTDANILTTTSNNSNPATDTSWTFNMTGDGWYQFSYVAGPNYSGGTTYAIYDIVYDSGTKQIYRSKADGNIGHTVSDPTWWGVISEPWQLLNSPFTTMNAMITSVNRILYPSTSAAFAAQAASAALEGVSDVFRRIDVQAYEFLGLAIDAMAADETAQLYNEGEKVARRAELIIASI